MQCHTDALLEHVASSWQENALVILMRLSEPTRQIQSNYSPRTTPTRECLRPQQTCASARDLIFKHTFFSKLLKAGESSVWPSPRRPPSFRASIEFAGAVSAILSMKDAPQILSLVAVGAASTYSSALHTLTLLHRRSLVAVGARDWNSSYWQMVRARHCLSNALVSA